MYNQKMYTLGKKSSVIREIFEYGNRRKAEIGAENVFDYSLGNPSIPAPQAVTDAILNLVNHNDPVSLHGYTSAPGDRATREAIADHIRKTFGIDAAMQRIYMTCGAAASLTISLHAVVNDGDEVIALAPFFPEYRVFAEKAGAKLVVVPCRESDFQIDFAALEAAINPCTKAIIVNSPNNPTGVVLSEETVRQLAALLDRKQTEYNHPIFLIADEPYRELVYDVAVPYLPCYYDNTLVCYSYSKSLSLPGERIGYIFVPPQVTDGDDIFAAICGAGRSLGFVCAPSLLQYVIRECVEVPSDIEAYRRNRDLLYNALVEDGFTVVKPDGAFYLFMKSPVENAAEFCEQAKKYELLIVPSDDFGFPGYVRLSYCVSEETIRNSLPAFRRLSEDYKK